MPTAPVAVLPYASPAAAGGYYPDGAWREGNVLIVRKNVALPPRCVKCGAPAEGPLMKRTYYWHDPILYILILAGILIYAIVALIVRKAGWSTSVFARHTAGGVRSSSAPRWRWSSAGWASPSWPG